jgi:hypothetical protein
MLWGWDTLKCIWILDMGQNWIYIYILVGFRRAVIFSVKEYTNNELTKTKK